MVGDFLLCRQEVIRNLQTFLFSSTSELNAPFTGHRGHADVCRVRDTDKVSEHRLAVVKQGTKLNAIQIFGVLKTLALIKNKTLHGHTCVDTQGKSESLSFILKLLAELLSRTKFRDHT